MRFVSFIFSLIFILFSSGKSTSQNVEIPVLQYVTVDRATQQVFLKWTVNDPGILNGYIVKRQIFNQPGVVDGTYNTIVTVNDPLQMNYIDNGSNYGVATPGLRTENYRIVAFTVVGANIELSNMSNLVSSIYLHPALFDPCKEQNSLIWTSYKSFGSDGKYRIFYSDTQTGTKILLGEKAITDTSFIHKQVDANRQYFYFIESVGTNGYSSVSNIQQITTIMPSVPVLMNADYASVEFANQLNLSFTLDASADVSSYKLLKSKYLNGPWDTISSYPKGTAQINTFDIIHASQEVVYYKVLAKNTCKLDSRSSNIAHNMVLEAWPDANTQYTNQLKWNPYDTWLGGVNNYKIFRSIDGAAFEEIAQPGANTTNYSDNIKSLVVPEINGQQSNGRFCYYIEATEGPSNPYGIAGISKSNISCAQQEAIVFIPNAFNPKSSTIENREFRPMMSFVSDYSLVIINRMGTTVFSSDDPMNGWDGTYKGQLQPKATYIYFLKYRTKDNKKVEKTGQVNLVY